MTHDQQQKRLNIFIKSGWVCGHCGGYLNRYSTAQLGHRINQSKVNIKKYGKSVIHNELNMVPVCSLRCNGAVAIGKSKTAEIERLVEEIKKTLK